MVHNRNVGSSRNGRDAIDMKHAGRVRKATDGGYARDTITKGTLEATETSENVV